MKNKFSRYNYLFRKEKQGILYNISSDGIMVLSPELVDLVIKYREDIDALNRCTRPCSTKCCVRG